MTPKEKAKELFEKFYYTIPSYELPIDDQVAKECALILAQEIDKELRANLEPNFTKKFWLEVKQEIEKL